MREYWTPLDAFGFPYFRIYTDQVTCSQPACRHTSCSYCAKGRRACKLPSTKESPHQGSPFKDNKSQPTVPGRRRSSIGVCIDLRCCAEGLNTFVGYSMAIYIHILCPREGGGRAVITDRVEACTLVGCIGWQPRTHCLARRPQMDSNMAS